MAEGGNGNVTGLLDFIVGSGAGGRLADERGAARNGYWHGYTLVRLHPSGDPQRTIVEQRPVFDWVGMTARKRRVGPNGTVTLEGYGREPVGSDQPIRYDRIDGPGITHRYDLVRADAQSPW